MAWLFGEVWLLCLVAFLLGAAITWVAFVVPARRAVRRRATFGHGWTAAAPTTPSRGLARPVTARPTPTPEPPGGPGSALAALDAWDGPVGGRPGSAEAALGALDELGVGRPREQAGPEPADARRPADDA
ncbi:hypothetical protein ACFQ34_23575 [Pseudonocardia benzenivorans]|uniref:Uncharacterized protein n=2 Tax=Pseudonocardia TaxID=1847 RepID=F4CYV6_PSEUX|nr:hypothetical protein [Pseudonocardia dioxanivorans]AEA27681.1 hypothetical protein Psed_5551 [Pseudonocardia dioxanivorans CB1190]